MTQLQIVYLPRSGTQERWRRLCQEVAGSRKEQFEASCRHMGITSVQVRLVQMLHSDLMLMTLHTQEPHQTLKALVNSEGPFDRWLRAQLQVLLGWNVQDILSELTDPQSDLIFSWGSLAFVQQQRRMGCEPHGGLPMEADGSAFAVDADRFLPVDHQCSGP